MLNIGCHLSVSKGFENMGKEALKLGGNTFQFFTRNPRGGKAKEIDKEDTDKLLILMKNNNFTFYNITCDMVENALEDDINLTSIHYFIKQ